MHLSGPIPDLELVRHLINIEEQASFVVDGAKHGVDQGLLRPIDQPAALSREITVERCGQVALNWLRKQSGVVPILAPRKVKQLEEAEQWLRRDSGN